MKKTLPIPKVLHHIWVGGNPLCDDAKKVMDSWSKVLPEYEIKLWNEDNYNVFENKLMQTAYNRGVYALVSDYARADILHREGGIYLDTDTEMLKPLDDFLNHSFFAFIQTSRRLVDSLHGRDQLDGDGRLLNERNRPFMRGLYISCGLIGGVPKNVFCKRVLEAYNGAGDLLLENLLEQKIISPQFYADILYDFGFRYRDERQELQEGIAIYPSELHWDRYSDTDITENAVSKHLCFTRGWNDTSFDNISHLSYLRKWL